MDAPDPKRQPKKRPTSSYAAEDLPPWEAAGPGYKAPTDDAPMIGRGSGARRHTNSIPDSYEHGIDPDVWVAKPGAPVHTTGSATRTPSRDYFGGTVMILFGLGVVAVGIGGIVIANQHHDPATGAAPVYGYWAVCAAGLLAMLRGLMVLAKKV